ncbi:MAG: glycosyltransferase [Bacteroidia bacterium]
MQGKKVIIAPLDWGLGHATRCVPVIREFLRQGAEVVIAADGRPLSFLQREFPALKTRILPGYQITYPRHKHLGIHLLMQSPKIIKAIQQEKDFIEKIAAEEKPHVIVSDNRFACRVHGVKNIYITHQIHVDAPLASSLSTGVHARYYNRFDEVWIPDVAETKNLSGKLSVSSSLKTPSRFVGILTRFESCTAEKKYDLLVMLSGPEPQRTIFEDILLHRLQQTSLRVLMVRGLAERNDTVIRHENGIDVADHLDTDELCKAIASSAVILSRPGYSTLSDLSVFGKPMIVVPTPGQTEQEYLAEYHSSAGRVVAASQDYFDPERAMRAAMQLQKCISYPKNSALLEEAVRSALTE